MNSVKKSEDGGWKIEDSAEPSLPSSILDHPSSHFYRCAYCGAFHLEGQPAAVPQPGNVPEPYSHRACQPCAEVRERDWEEWLSHNPAPVLKEAA